VGFFRRKETLNERLMREAGMAPEPEPPQPFEPEPKYRGPSYLGGPPLFDNPAFTGNSRPRRWDAVAVVDAPEIGGDEVSFVSLPDGSLIVDQEEGDNDLTRLADAVEQQLARPYRALAKRQSGTTWAVSAARVQVAQFESAGDYIDLTKTDEGTQLLVDGSPASGTIPALEQLGDAVSSAYAIHAERLDADVWEVGVSAL
jgi:hypothetical protein